jgi:hypothetical protein
MPKRPEQVISQTQKSKICISEDLIRGTVTSSPGFGLLDNRSAVVQLKKAMLGEDSSSNNFQLERMHERNDESQPWTEISVNFARKGSAYQSYHHGQV